MVKSALGIAIRIDRSVQPAYPKEMSFDVHFRLLSLGLAEYDPGVLELFLWGFQRGERRVEGKWLHDHLKRTRMIERCLDLRDALEIQKLGGDVFRVIFGDSTIFFWRSTAQDRHGDEQVPYLCLKNGSVVLGWRRVKEHWGVRDPAVLFPK